MRARRPPLAAALVLTLACLATHAAAAPPGAAGTAAPGATAAGTDGVAALVRGVDDHPSLRAARAAREAARLRLQAVRSPVALSVSYEYRRLTVEPATDPLPPPFDDLFAVEETSDVLTMSVVLRPFLVGDLSDLARSRAADLERSELGVREARAALEAQAVQAAAGVLLAERGVALAAEGLALAREAAEATAVRADRGAATPLDAQRAELAVQDAARGLAAAERGAERARDGLARLSGDARLTALPDLEPVAGVPPDLVRATLDLALAELGVAAQDRGLLPTVQAGYSWFLDEGGTVTVGVESRTLQPTVSYSSGGGAAGGFGDLAPPGAAPAVRGAFSASVSWSISPQAVLERQAAVEQAVAAAAALASAHDRASLERLGLDATLAAADETLALAALERDLAAAERDAAERRFDAGAIGPLELAQARLGASGAELAWWQARADRLAAVLDTYQAYAIPISEVHP